MPLPSNPSNNQTAVVNGILYTYNSTKGAWTVSTNSEVSYTMSAVTTTGLVTAGNIKTTSGIFWSNGAPLGGSAGGTTNQIQYNSSNSFAGATNFTYTAASGNVVIGATTATSSTTTGALVVAGGAGIAGNLWAGGNSIVFSGSAPTLTFSAANPTISASSYINFPGGAYFNSGTVYAEAQLRARGGIANDTGTKILTIGSTSQLSVANTMSSTSTTTGALVVAGGVGIAGRTTIGGIADVTGAAYLRNTTYLGSQLVQNIAADATTLYLRGGALAFQDAAASATKLYIDTSSNVGIGISSPTANLHIKKSTNGIYFEPVGNWAGKVFNATDAANEHGLVVGQRWAAAASTAFEVGSTYGDGSTAWRSYFKIDGLGGATLSSGGSERIIMSSGTGNLVINATTTSTSTTTGALVVKGGAGIAGQVTAGNVMTTSGVFWANGAAYSSGSGGGPTWAPVQTANITAVVNTAYPVDATSSNITVTLPSSPAAGSQVIISDYKQVLSSSKTITIYPNGGKIYGNTGNATLNNFGQSVNLTYIDSTQGWIMPFGVQVGFLTNYSITYMIVAGGGGGGSDMGGGGGAGGYLASSAYVTPGLTYSITVGAGGAGAPAGTYQIRGLNGSDSTIGRLAITSIGGGGGGSEYGGGSYQAGNPGGSGGGAAGGSASGGSGTSGQGYAGGGNGGVWYMGGGGGAGGSGSGSGGPATGGPGVQNAILGTNYYWCGGGGGSGYSINGAPGGAGGGGGGAVGSTSGGSGINAGSPGGGGTTGSQTNTPGGNAGQYTGGGGGGGSHYNSNNYGGSGGAGIVVISYTGQRRGTGGTFTTVSGNSVHAFYSSGTFIA